MLKEIWKDIEGYEGLYQISNFGRINSLVSKRASTILVPSTVHNGYYRILLSKNGIIKRFRIHRLVAKAFIPNPLNKPFVNHKDSNRKNNHVNNLEWCTPKENINHSQKSINGKFNERNKKINQYDLSGNLIKSWDDATQAGKELGMNRNNIYSCCTGERKSSMGYIWKHADV